MQDIETILQGYTNGGGASALLRRAVLSYEDWYVFLQEQDAREMLEGKKAKPKLFVDQEGRRHAFFFTDPSHVESAKKLFPFEFSGESLRASGEWGVRSLSSKADVLHLIGAEGAHLQVQSSELPSFLQLSKEVQVESALAAIDAATSKLPEMLHRVCSFDSYWIALPQSDGAMPATVQRDGKTLLAIFTAKDTLNAFFATLPEEQRPTALSQGGPELFLYLVRLHGIDGVIFNCAGPVSSHSFSNDFIQSVLQTNSGLIRKAAFRRLLTRSPYAFTADELSKLSEEQNKAVLSLLYLSMLADGEIKESEYHFLQEVLSSLPWRWGSGQARTLELANELRVKFARAASGDIAAEIDQLCSSLSHAPKEKLLVGLFAQLLSDDNFAEKERQALARYSALLNIPKESAREAISNAVKFLNTLVS